MYLCRTGHKLMPMEEERPNIVIADSLEGIDRRPLVGYVAHAYCHAGMCRFTFGEHPFTLGAGDCLITRRCDLVKHLEPSSDLRMDVIYVTPEFIALSTPPYSNYGTRGQLSLFNNPIMHLTPEQQAVCALDFDFVKRRLALSSHHFHFEAMRNAIECMIIDFFDFHAALNGTDDVPTYHAQLMRRFVAMLERGDFRRQRELAYYASELCVTPKYLSDVSRQCSGFPAGFWITRYTALDISRRLRSKQQNVAELSDLYGFSSPSYFSRYVKKHLGILPKELRD